MKILIKLSLVLGIFYVAATGLPKVNTMPGSNIITYEQVYPVFVRNCASCHNAQTPGMNWLDRNEVETSKGVLYQRVFVQGDMPMFFRFFGGSEKRLLKKYLEQIKLDWKE